MSIIQRTVEIVVNDETGRGSIEMEETLTFPTEEEAEEFMSEIQDEIRQFELWIARYKKENLVEDR